jgi:hypothetical protein
MKQLIFSLIVFCNVGIVKSQSNYYALNRDTTVYFFVEEDTVVKTFNSSNELIVTNLKGDTLSKEYLKIRSDKLYVYDSISSTKPSLAFPLEPKVGNKFIFKQSTILVSESIDSLEVQNKIYYDIIVINITLTDDTNFFVNHYFAKDIGLIKIVSSHNNSHEILFLE